VLEAVLVDVAVADEWPWPVVAKPYPVAELWPYPVAELWPYPVAELGPYPVDVVVV
jgi:hypothetical protein